MQNPCRLPDIAGLAGPPAKIHDLRVPLRGLKGAFKLEGNMPPQMSLRIGRREQKLPIKSDQKIPFSILYVSLCVCMIDLSVMSF